MRIGYACLTIGVQNANLKRCTAKNATDEKLLDIISYNLKSLENIIEYNIKQNIKLFRISSDLIPFGSSEINKLHWWDIFYDEFSRIGKKICENEIRISMHPGQYTVLNSLSSEVVKKAIDDLNYHTKVLDSFGVKSDNKIVLHIGGVYNDKDQAINRFLENYEYLSNTVKDRLVIENDDKSYNINDILEISTKLNIPAIFDNLHNKINCYSDKKNDSYWINECKKTWREKDGQQKIHYSEQDPLKKQGSHSSTIGINEFINFYECLERDDIDIMLEVKDKNLSAVKCINSLFNNNINHLEEEWNKYKYAILEKSPSKHLEIENLLKNKYDCNSIKFYNYIEESLKEKGTIEDSIDAAINVFESFKNTVETKEKENFKKYIEDYKQEKISIEALKNKLLKLAAKYNELEILDSYYFII